MLKYCPECGSDKITCEPVGTVNKDGSLGAKIVNMVTKLVRRGAGMPRGQFVYQCKQCGKSGIIHLN